jgi:O-antigen/teichoic acid export membrane protein
MTGPRHRSRPASVPDPVARPDPAEHPEALGRLVRRGLGWGLGANAFGRLGIFLTGIVLARLLDPSEYGEFNVAIVALVLLANFNDLGLEQTLVRWPDSLDRIAPTAVTVVFGASVLVFAVAMVGAGPFAAALGAPQAANMVRLLAVGVLINGACAVPSALLTRDFAQDKRTLADGTGFVVSTAITVWMAVEGYGAWSLVWGRVIGNAVVSGMHVVLAPRRFRPGWSTPVARELLHHGLPLAGASLVAVALLNVDYVVVARVFDLEQLGLYLMAFNLSSWPVSMLSTAVAMVALPGFARLQHDRVALRQAFLTATHALASVAFPVAVLVSVCAVPLIGVLYGSPWVPAAAALHTLALLGAARVLILLGGDLLAAVGSGRALLALQLVWLAALVPALAVGARWGGLAGVGVAHLVVAGVVVVPFLGWALAQVGVPRREVARVLARPAAGAAAATGVALVAMGAPLGDLARLVVAGGAGLGAYLVVQAPVLAELVRTLRSARTGGTLVPAGESAAN